MAKKRVAGGTKNTRDSRGRRLGVKIFGGGHVRTGGIIVRQRGTKFYPGLNVFSSKDHTLHSYIDGEVFFAFRKRKCFVCVNPFILSTQS